MTRHPLRRALLALLVLSSLALLAPGCSSILDLGALQTGDAGPDAGRPRDAAPDAR